MWFRDKWPLKRFYWQKEELEDATLRAREMAEKLFKELQNDQD